MEPSKRPIASIKESKKTEVTKVEETPEVTFDFLTDEEVFNAMQGDYKLNADRFIFPSRGIFYKEKTLSYTSYTVADLKTIKKFIATDNITYLIDVIQNKVKNFDVRDLTVDDFIALIIQITLNSYPNPKYELEWTSFYGNINKKTFIIPELKLIEINLMELKKMREDILKYNFTAPRVKYFEVLYNKGFKKAKKNSEWDESQTWIYEEIGQYYNFDSLEKQLNHAENLETKSAEFLALSKFKKYILHGLVTRYEVKDSKFKAAEALEFLKKKEKLIKNSIEGLLEEGTSLEEAVGVIDLIRITGEIERIELELKEGKSVEPMTESIEMPIDLPSLMQPLFD